MTFNDRSKHLCTWPSRRGVGILLVLVLAIIVVLMVVGLGQHQFTSALAMQTLRSSVGQTCLSLADSAIHETLNGLRHQVNDPTDALFPLMRKEVYINDTGFLPILSGAPPLPQLDKLVENPNFKHFHLSHQDLKATVEYQRQFADLPYERFGLIKVVARTHYDLGFSDSVARQIEVGYGFKVVLVGPPRPFDQTSIYVRDADRVTDFTGPGGVNQHRADYVQSIDDVLARAGQAAADARTPSSVKSLYADVSAEATPVATTVHAETDFPSEGIMFSTRTVTFNMQDTALLNRLQDKEAQSLTPAKTLVSQAAARQGANPGDEQANRDLAAALMAETRALRDVVGLIKSFQDNYLIWTGTERDSLEHFHYKLGPQMWQQKAFYVLDEARPDPLDVQFAQLLERLTPAANGVIFVRNPSTPLDIDGRTIHGKLVIVSGQRGGVRLANVNRGETDRDLLTVLNLGGGTMSLEGEVHAAVFSWDGRIEAKPGTQVFGQLLVDRLPDPTERNFSVTRLEKYFTGRTTTTDTSGAFPGYYYVGISPKPVYRKVVRQ